MTISRRRMLSGLGLSLPLGLTLAGCAAAPTRVPRLLRLEADPEPELGAAIDLSAAPVWHLQRVQLPAYLDRELVLAGQGAGALQALPEVRWAEPLAEAVPRLLRRDLARAAAEAGQPAQVWGAALPAGLRAALRLRIDIERLEADRVAGRMRLAAIWGVSDPAGRQAARAGQLELAEPLVGDSSAEALVAAHRCVLQRLAQAVAASCLRAAQPSAG
ncbi:hypothetical protein X805_02170 [Sphaerotilus natans subsp. natans DSM 6575]|uniref:ABC-type transport auxiliary lipoprotein component domain-containing protein n=1 Tax=Sphaerotilus natans subsp. natans DSM 6575 TaxID=1286631 RepID=A0A059KS89_9BURK|nr:ABC-type transport auxiliary lipoprotein family protein [Sphaerotilus natans]KDB54235.1 hypothetical protein X805_02170 [Sphaerotilus natans subsp. natans DSM 6575]SIQ23202.1 hypothetical protein SAMN05421778_102127 [Sphaerotilus natans]